jgi:hypothetical protein
VVCYPLGGQLLGGVLVLAVVQYDPVLALENASAGQAALWRLHLGLEWNS